MSPYTPPPPRYSHEGQRTLNHSMGQRQHWWHCYIRGSWNWTWAPQLHRGLCTVHIDIAVNPTVAWPWPSTKLAWPGAIWRLSSGSARARTILDLFWNLLKPKLTFSHHGFSSVTTRDPSCQGPRPGTLWFLPDLSSIRSGIFVSSLKGMLDLWWKTGSQASQRFRSGGETWLKPECCGLSSKRNTKMPEQAAQRFA